MATSPRAPWRRALELGGTALLWSGSFTLVFALWLFVGRSFNTFPPAKAELVAHGGASRPYSARVLVPWAARALLAPIPAGLRAHATARIAALPPVARLLGYFDTAPEFALELLLVVLLDGLALAGFMVVLGRWFDALYRAAPGVSRVAPVVAVLVLPMFFARGAHYFYDLPALFFFTLALHLIHERRQGALCVALALGTLNKETTALALLVAWLEERRRPADERRPGRLLVLLLVVVAARAAALWLSAPAGPISATNNYLRNYLVGNAIAFLADPLLENPVAIATLGAFVLLVFARWATKPAFLRRTLPVVALFVLLHFWGSQWGELRSLYEVFPILFLLAFQTVAELLGSEIRAADAGPVAHSTGERWDGTPWALAALLGLGLLFAGAVAALLVLA